MNLTTQATLSWVGAMGLVVLTCGALSEPAAGQSVRGPKSATAGLSGNPPVVGQIPDMQGFPGVPQRLRDLSDLRLCQGTGLERSEILLRWIVEERNHPREPQNGVGGGPIDSSYVTINLIAALSGADRRVLRWLTQRKRVANAYLSSCLAIALGEAGDIQQHARVAKIATDDADGYLRLEAANALSAMGAPELLQVLQLQAAHDPFVVVVQDKPFFVVRNAAEHMLRTIRQRASGTHTGGPGMGSSWRRAEFQKSISDYDTFVKNHVADLNRLLRICNGHAGAGQ